MPHLIHPKILDTLHTAAHRTQVTLLQVLDILLQVLAIHHRVATNHRVLATLTAAMALGHLLLQGSLTHQVSQ